MVVLNRGSMEGILNTYNAKEWTKGFYLDSEKELKFKEAPEPGKTYEEKQLSFGEVLSKSLSEVNSLQGDANKAIQRLVTGESNNIHETMLAMEKADIAFKAMNQIRTKVLDAYKEVMRMQV